MWAKQLHRFSLSAPQEFLGNGSPNQNYQNGLNIQKMWIFVTLATIGTVVVLATMLIFTTSEIYLMILSHLMIQFWSLWQQLDTLAVLATIHILATLDISLMIFKIIFTVSCSGRFIVDIFYNLMTFFYLQKSHRISWLSEVFYSTLNSISNLKF